MSSTLASRQGILRRTTNRLSSLLQQYKDLLTPRPSTGQGPDVEDQNVRQRALRQAKTAIELESEKVEDALDKYTNTADSLDASLQTSPEILEKIESNIETAHELLDEAQMAITTLALLQQELGSSEVPHSSETPDISKMKLTPIPVPKFSGEIWEWETFWKSFEHSVDSRNIDDIYKLNYLLDSLQGKVRESVKQFEVSGATYPLVVAYLKNKYDDKEALVERLISNLQAARAHTGRLEDQETLCDELESIVSQLKIKGEHVDNVFLQRQLLSKFSPDLQRHILRQKAKYESEGSWDTLTLLSMAKEYVKEELRVSRQMEQWTNSHTFAQTDSNIFNGEHCNPRPNLCFYCEKSGHQPESCNEARSLEQRIQIMKTQKLCHNCGRKDHMTANCTRGACRMCKEKGHHTSICRKLNLPLSNETTAPETPASISAALNSHILKSSTNSSITSLNPPNTVNPNDTPPMEESKNHSEAQILVGQARVLNPTSGTLETIHVILDTGADRSFISNELADRLQLEVISTTRLAINTFGSRKPVEKTYSNTILKMWDMEGTQHAFTVTRTKTITTSLMRSSLSTEDRKFLFENNIQLSVDPSIREVQPTVLLGCADLFSVLSVGLKIEYTLPSGMKAIPSKLGYLITGRNNTQLTDVEKPLAQPVRKTNTQEDFPEQPGQEPKTTTPLNASKHGPTKSSSFSTNRSYAEMMRKQPTRRKPTLPHLQQPATAPCAELLHSLMAANGGGGQHEEVTVTLVSAAPPPRRAFPAPVRLLPIRLLRASPEPHLIHPASPSGPRPPQPTPMPTIPPPPKPPDVTTQERLDDGARSPPPRPTLPPPPARLRSKPAHLEAHFHSVKTRVKQPKTRQQTEEPITYKSNRRGEDVQRFHFNSRSRRISRQGRTRAGNSPTNTRTTDDSRAAQVCSMNRRNRSSLHKQHRSPRSIENPLYSKPKCVYKNGKLNHRRNDISDLAVSCFD